ncbi:aldehyde dehydrogenase family protein [Lacisediminimonas profundi]|uniref:aldehyde dehydrogenase family protein n=1 Tax=Lacisediminimonas profundi TaxID=2603856 RepID=UPI00124B66D6|nr:aldehyde dehydrogenase family protein [Lacisediminimonas profundi]
MSYTIPSSYDHFVNGQWMPSSGTARLECASPLTQEILTTVPDATAADLDAAVAAAAAAQPGWADVPARKRQALLEAAADRLVAEVERLAWLETANTGKPIRESRANVMTAADRLRYYAGACRVFEGVVVPVTRDITSYGLRKPLGVIGIIGAWNFPLNMFVGKIAPAIAAGNCVVYKPADATPVTTLEIAALLAECLPPGVVNVITGRGDTAGAGLVAHPGVRKISVTGSSETGRRVMAGASSTIKRLTLELGGKNAQIVYPDADLDRAAQGILLGAFMNQGQVCTAGSRILAHRDIAAGLKERILSLVPRLRVGDPFDPATRMGTVSTRTHFDRVASYIELGKREGGRLLCGGEPVRVDAWPRGLFMAPTLFEGLAASARVAQEEIFGPVATFSEWDDEAAMLDEVNGVEQGLAAGVWTSSLSRAHAAAEAVQTGRVWVNCYNLFPSGAAFGGSKASGFGREDAFETLLDFTEVKNVIVDAAPDYRSFYE